MFGLASTSPGESKGHIPLTGLVMRLTVRVFSRSVSEDVVRLASQGAT